MDIAARLTPALAAQLRVALGAGHALTDFPDWEALLVAIRTKPVDVVVVDPQAEADGGGWGGGMRTDEIRALIKQYPTLPVVAYVAVTPDTVRAMIEMAKFGVEHVVLRGFEDEPRRFRELVERLPVHWPAEAVVEELAPWLSNGPPRLSRAVARMFETPHAFLEADDLAAAAGITRRSLDRWLERIGVAPARLLLAAARVARGVHYMRDPGFLLDDIIQKLGYPSPRRFGRQVRQVTGLTPSMLRAASKDDEQVVELLTKRLHRHERSMIR